MSALRVVCNQVSNPRATVMTGSMIEICEKCGQSVWLSPATAITVQEAMALNPDWSRREIICVPCASEVTEKILLMAPSPGQVAEIKAEVARRNA